MTRRFVAACSMLLFAGAASAQSATVTVSASSTTVAPGDTVSITVSSMYDTAGASGGVFGSAGFYGFGGDVDASGSSVDDVTPTVPMLNGSLTSGPVSMISTSPALVRAAAGRGLMGGIADNPATMMTFDLTIDAEAAPGEVTLDFDGAVVLVLGDTLTTYSTDPGANQSMLMTNSVTITIQDTSCPGDLTTTGTAMGQPGFGEPDGVTNLSDLLYYVNVWNTDLGTPTPNPSSIADVTTTGTSTGQPGFGEPDGNVDLSDLLFFVNEWNSGLGECS